MAKLNAGNVYDAGVQQTLDPQTVAMIKMLQSPNRTISTPNRQLTVRSDQLAPTVEADRLRRQQTSMDDRQDALQRVGPGLGRWAPAMGGIKAAAQMLQRPIDEAKQDDLYARIVAAEQAKKAEAAQAQADQQARDAQAAVAKREADMADWQAKEQYKRDNPMPITPEEKIALALSTAQLSELQDKGTRAQEKHDSEQAEVQAQVGKKQKLQDSIKEDVAWLLDPARKGDMGSATGSVEGLIPSVKQGTVDWEDRFTALQSKLTGENLDLMSGVLSESDIAILRDIAGGGLNFRSGEGRMTEGLQNIGSGLGMDFTAPEAPPAALEFLKNNPHQIDFFENKYGYRPEGY